MTTLSSAFGPLEAMARSPLAPGVPDSATNHMCRWLELNGYTDVARSLTRFAGASVGGLVDPNAKITRDPILLKNGWGDRLQHAATFNPFQAAPLFSHGYELLLNQLDLAGYPSRAISGATVGPGDPVRSQLTKLSKDLVLWQRRVLEAQIAYIDAHSNGDLRFVRISHSGGGLVDDAIIKGGRQVSGTGSDREIYDIGPSLAHRFRLTVMASVPRAGIPQAHALPWMPLYLGNDGFHPDAEFVERNNDNPVRVSDKIYCVFPWFTDELMAPTFDPSTHPTCVPPHGPDADINGTVAFATAFPSHVFVKDFGAEVIARLAIEGKMPASPQLSSFPFLTQAVPIPVTGGFFPASAVVAAPTGELLRQDRLLDPITGAFAAQSSIVANAMVAGTRTMAAWSGAMHAMMGIASKSKPTEP